MTTNTGRTIAATYKNLLNIDNSNTGIDGTLRTVQDGEGTSSALQLSQSGVNINGDFYIGGVQLTTNVSALNAAGGSADAITSINAVLTSITAVVSQNTAVITSVSAALETRIAAVSVLTSVNAAQIATTSAALATSIANVSVLTSVNAANIAAVSVLTSVNAAQIAAVSALVSANTAAITSVSAALETRINAVSVLAAGASAAAASVSTALETRINAVSVLAAGASAAAASVSTALETRINAVSVLVSTVSAAITSVSTALETRIAAVSAAAFQKTGGQIDGNVTVSGTVDLIGAVYGNRASLTDAASIAISMASANHFIVQLTGNRALEAPTNIQPTQTGSIIVVQNVSGGKTLSFNSAWKFPAGTAPTLSTAASAVDRIDFEVYSSTAIHAVATLNL